MEKEEAKEMDVERATILELNRVVNEKSHSLMPLVEYCTQHATLRNLYVNSWVRVVESERLPQHHYLLFAAAMEEVCRKFQSYVPLFERHFERLFCIIFFSCNSKSSNNSEEFQHSLLALLHRLRFPQPVFKPHLIEKCLLNCRDCFGPCLRWRRENVIDCLYSTAFRCSTCGLRQQCQTELAAHLDWHFKTNQEKRRHGSRPYFCAAKEWIDPASLCLSIAQETVRLKPCMMEIETLAEESCAICGERYPQILDQEDGVWKVENVVRVLLTENYKQQIDTNYYNSKTILIHIECAR